MSRRSLSACVSWLFVPVALLLAASCGGGSSPSSASGSGAVVVQGVVLGAGAASGSLSASAGEKTASGTITVTVEGSGLTTTVSANGTFELEDVPSGTFVLVFKKDGVEMGRVTITAAGGSEVKITVQLQGTTSTTIVVVEIKVDDTGDQGGTTPSPEPSAAACLISGGRVGSGIELEGNVASGTAAAFKLSVDGERAGGLVDVSASAASFKCNGGGKPTDAECKASLKAGAKVHVRGTLMTCSGTAAAVTASQVTVQKGSND